MYFITKSKTCVSVCVCMYGVHEVCMELSFMYWYVVCFCLKAQKEIKDICIEKFQVSDLESQKHFYVTKWGA